MAGSPHWEPELGRIARSKNRYTVKDAPGASSGPGKTQLSESWSLSFSRDRA